MSANRIANQHNQLHVCGDAIAYYAPIFNRSMRVLRIVNTTERKWNEIYTKRCVEYNPSNNTLRGRKLAIAASTVQLQAEQIITK